MSVTNTVIQIALRSPRAGKGFHDELHIEPEILARLRAECLVHAGFPVDVDEGLVCFLGMPIVEDPTAIFAEVRLAPDRKPRVSLIDRILRSRGGRLA
jgi:hypothetical protein